jgi:hypothetical protein
MTGSEELYRLVLQGGSLIRLHSTMGSPVIPLSASHRDFFLRVGGCGFAFLVRSSSIQLEMIVSPKTNLPDFEPVRTTLWRTIRHVTDYRLTPTWENPSRLEFL